MGERVEKGKVAGGSDPGDWEKGHVMMCPRGTRRGRLRGAEPELRWLRFGACASSLSPPRAPAFPFLLHGGWWGGMNTGECKG